MSDTPFTWGESGSKDTPAARRRRIAEALMAKGIETTPIQHWTQGMARVAQGLVGGWEARQADELDRSGRASVSADAASLMAGGAAVPSATSAPSTAPVASVPSGATPDIKNGIVQTAQAIGADPVDLATAISYETGGTFNPTQAGPRTQWGQHRGLIQFGEPQAKQHGVDWSNPVGSQLGPNGAVASYLKSSGFKPGMNFLDLYSTINAGAPGLYNRSDAKNGGAPGTVRDKVEQQMQGHRAKAEALLRSAQADMPAEGAVPVEGASGQPGFAIPPGEGLAIMQPGGALPNFDQATGRWNGPSAAAPAPEQAVMPEGPAPAMTAQTFNAVQGGQPLEPVFQAEGASQPWMGTAIAPQPAAPMIAQAPAQLPPPRPADLPAPGAVEAIGQLPPQAAPPPQMMPDLSNSPDGGMRALQVQSEQARQNQPAAPQEAVSPFARVAQALGIPSQQPAVAPAPSPAVARVAEAVGAAPVAAPAAAATSPGVDRVASAMRVLNSPYAQPGQKAIATLVVQQAFKDPQETELKRLTVEKARREAENAPLDAEGRKLDIETKRKALNKAEPPVTREIEVDGVKATQQWNPEARVWESPKSSVAPSADKNPYALSGKPTEGQSKDTGFANRMVESHNLINGLEAVGLDKGQAARGAIPIIGNSLSSPDKQKFEQAKRNFVTSILRKESGASIAPTEFETAEKQYFPQVGDSPEVIAQKRTARETAIEGVMAGAGPGYKVPDTYKPGAKAKGIDTSKPGSFKFNPATGKMEPM